MRVCQVSLRVMCGVAVVCVVTAVSAYEPDEIDPVLGPVSRDEIDPVLAPVSRSGPGIFVPKPKGDTLDPESGGGTSVDTVTTIPGDRLTGRVIGAGEDGLLHVAAPQFHGEAVVKVSALDLVTLRGGSRAGGADEIMLTNGDRLLGEIVAITKDAVIVETNAAGPVKVRRPVVASLSLSRGRSVLVDSRFEAGQMAPWAVRRGSWPIKDGALTCATSGSRYTIYAKLDQSEPVTFEAKVKATGGSNLRCTLMVFAERSESSYGRNSVFGMFYNNQYYLQHAWNDSTYSVVNKPLGTTLKEGTFRVGYNPTTGKARLWMNDKLLCEHEIPAGRRPSTGKYVMFSSYYPCAVRSLRVYRGVAGASPGGEAAEEADTVQFGNKDRITSTDIRLADGIVTLTTPLGEIRSPVEKLTSVVFRKKGREVPRRQKGDVTVQTSDSRLTLTFKELTADHLVGASDCLGEVTIKRNAVRSIRFNIYRGASQ